MDQDTGHVTTQKDKEKTGSGLVSSLSTHVGLGAFRDGGTTALKETDAIDVAEILEKVYEGRPVSLPAPLAIELAEQGLVERLSDRKFRELKREHESIKEVHADMARETRNLKDANKEADTLEGRLNSIFYRGWMTITFRSDQLQTDRVKLNKALKDKKKARKALVGLEPKEERLVELGEHLAEFTPSTEGYLTSTKQGEGVRKQLRARPKTYRDLSYGEAKDSADRWSSLLRRTRHGTTKEGLSETVSAALSMSSVRSGDTYKSYLSEYKALSKKKNMGPEAASRLIVAAVESEKHELADYLAEYKNAMKRAKIDPAGAAQIAVEVVERNLNSESVIKKYDKIKDIENLGSLSAAILATASEQSGFDIQSMVKQWRIGWEVEVDSGSAATMAAVAVNEKSSLTDLLNAWFECQKLSGCDGIASTRMAIASVVSDIPIARFLAPWRIAYNAKGATPDAAAQMATLSVSSGYDLDLLLESFGSAHRGAKIPANEAAQIVCFNTGVDIETLPSIQSLQTFEFYQHAAEARKYDSTLDAVS